MSEALYTVGVQLIPWAVTLYATYRLYRPAKQPPRKSACSLVSVSAAALAKGYVVDAADGDFCLFIQTKFSGFNSDKVSVFTVPLDGVNEDELLVAIEMLPVAAEWIKTAGTKT